MLVEKLSCILGRDLPEYSPNKFFLFLILFGLGQIVILRKCKGGQDSFFRQKGGAFNCDMTGARFSIVILGLSESLCTGMEDWFLTIRLWTDSAISASGSAVIVDDAGYNFNTQGTTTRGALFYGGSVTTSGD